MFRFNRVKAPLTPRRISMLVFRSAAATALSNSIGKSMGKRVCVWGLFRVIYGEEGACVGTL